MIMSLYKTTGLPSLSHTYRNLYNETPLKDVPLTCLFSENSIHMFRDNLNTILESQLGKSNERTVMWSLKIDEIAIEKRLRYKSNTHEISGLRCNHSNKGLAF